jgi:predicted PhzF superfamily epimerase YddE/YHI9
MRRLSPIGAQHEAAGSIFALMIVLRVFTDADGQGGNKLGVVLDAESIDHDRRQAIATEVGFSETIFVENGARVAIFTPASELPFAGHPMVGAAWLLGAPTLHPPAGPVAARRDGECAYITATAAYSLAWETRQLNSVEEVERLEPAADNYQAWAWKDEAAGRIRARVFAPDFGIPEDPATGSAAMVLCSQLGRAIEIEQASGSELFVRPLGGDQIELGGRVVRDSR